jgi:glyoxylase-like metal-dependent hydrolase (beta-lactamase superfamily II)
MPGSPVRSGTWQLALTAVLTLSALAVLVGYRSYYGRNDAVHRAARASRLVRSAVAVVPGIYLLGGLSPSAVYVIKSSQGLILVDSGLDSDAGPLKAEMAKLGLDWRQVRRIMLTHAHGDHTGGAERLRKETGALIYAGQEDVAVLRTGHPREAFFSTFFMPDHTPHPTTIDISLAGGEIITLGDARIQALATPGHTPGSTCYLLKQNSLRVLFAGDVIMMLRGDDNPRTELGKPLGTYSAYLAPRYRGDAQQSLASLQRLRALPVPDLVLPGHPGADVTPQSPWLSQARWESLLDQGIRDMETLLARYKADGALFLDGSPKQLLPDLYYLGNFQGAAIYGLFASSRFFVVGTLGGHGFVEFLNHRLEQLGRKPMAPSAILLTSCGASDTAGLEELIAKCHTQVVASATGLESLRTTCPSPMSVLPPAELARAGWFSVEPMPLQGRGVAPIAYQVRWAGKSVLFSGRMPVKINQQSGEKLVFDLTNPPGDVRGYFSSMMQLHGLKPDLWLPATPIDDQNANLYDSDWERAIEDNLIVIRLILSTALKH